LIDTIARRITGDLFVRLVPGRDPGVVAGDLAVAVQDLRSDRDLAELRRGHRVELRGGVTRRHPGEAHGGDHHGGHQHARGRGQHGKLCDNTGLFGEAWCQHAPRVRLADSGHSILGR
jgi:hypothetical protein